MKSRLVHIAKRHHPGAWYLAVRGDGSLESFPTSDAVDGVAATEGLRVKWDSPDPRAYSTVWYLEPIPVAVTQRLEQLRRRVHQLAQDADEERWPCACELDEIDDELAAIAAAIDRGEAA